MLAVPRLAKYAISSAAGPAMLHGYDDGSPSDSVPSISRGLSTYSLEPSLVFGSISERFEYSSLDDARLVEMLLLGIDGHLAFQPDRELSQSRRLATPL